MTTTGDQQAAGEQTARPGPRPGADRQQSTQTTTPDAGTPWPEADAPDAPEAAGEPAEGSGTAPSPGITKQDVYSLLGALGAITTLVAAVMFYFGWRRSDVQSRAMGIDVSLFGYSSQDYVLRSISSLYTPMLVMIGLVLAWLWVHGKVIGWLRSERSSPPASRRRAREIARWVGVASTTLAVSCVLFSIAAGSSNPVWPVEPIRDALDERQWVVPCTLVIATLVATYAWWIHQQLTPSVGRGERPLWQRVLPVVLVAGTVTLGTFWMLEEYASAVGRGQARRLLAGLSQLPHAEVTSSTPLGIRAAGVVEERIDTGSDEVRYRTTGLRLLARSGGKVLLLHDGWDLSTGSVIVLPDSPDFAWQFSR
jgi:hypothetical protein